MQKKTLIIAILIITLLTVIAAEIVSNQPVSIDNIPDDTQPTQSPVTIVMPNMSQPSSPSSSPVPSVTITPRSIDDADILFVSLSGTISLSTRTGTFTDANLNPTYIIFTDEATGVVSEATISNVTYSIKLLNQHTYTVRGFWNGTAGNSPVSEAFTVYVSSNVVSGVMVHDLMFPHT